MSDTIVCPNGKIIQVDGPPPSINELVDRLQKLKKKVSTEYEQKPEKEDYRGRDEALRMKYTNPKFLSRNIGSGKSRAEEMIKKGREYLASLEKR